ncbi:Gfo/Idh/MocA family oxidoreductase [Georgenia satyanarayanai]|uniref:Gfo/Idh/MocA family protein n=1 Tax=Georgenia satyanarayanai TaxID=860221 RepID=UPI0020419A84|nr:Gfo/Idh/MocA family oxidoreductase [Georgenia satyanarayanai]MCM3661400.1 Gfo/Idh/MocA family oxidoreductase [Georgenia satyanarayanai]
MLRVGLLGLGFIGRTHLAAFNELEDAEVVGVATAGSPSDGPFRHYTDPYALISAADVDAVVIAVPTDLHADFAVAALDLGKDVLIEKPVTLTLGEAARIAGSSAKGGVAMVAHVLRHTAEYVAAVDLIAGGSLGEVQGARSHRMSAPPRWSSWLADPARSGGALFDLLVHDFDLMNWILGAPTSVVALGHQDAQGGWDHVEVSLRYADRPALAHVHGSQRMPKQYPFTAGLHVVGDRGALELVNRHDGSQIDGEAESAVIRYFDDEPPRREGVAAEDPFVVQARAFTAAVRDRRVPAGLGVTEAAMAVRTAVAAHRSLVACEEVVVSTV